jgi:hypothetical protein
MRFTWRDALATTLVAAAAALEVVHLAGADAPGLAGGRALTGAMLLLGIAACAAGSTEMATLPIGYARWMSFLGATAVVITLAGLISGAFSMPAVLTVTIVAMWAAATIRHLTTTAPAATEEGTEEAADAVAVTDEALHRLIDSHHDKVGGRH